MAASLGLLAILALELWPAALAVRPKADVTSVAVGPGGTLAVVDRVQGMALIQRKSGTMYKKLEAAEALAVESAEEASEVALHASNASDLDEGKCHTALPGEECYEHVLWAREIGINKYKYLYPRMDATNTFEDFQAFIHKTNKDHQCPQPCKIPKDAITWPGGPTIKSGWCAVEKPADTWSLNYCPGPGSVNLKVLTYNLFWWNLFGRRGGNGGSAGRVIKAANENNPIDVIGFQEADDPQWPMNDAGIVRQYAYEHPGTPIAYRKDTWKLLTKGKKDVTKDPHPHCHGTCWTRSVVWVRLEHKELKKKLFFMNFHGSIPIGWGGECGGESTSYQTLKVISQNAKLGDMIVMVGDFNAMKHHGQIKTMEKHLHRVLTGRSFNGIDHIFSNCNNNSITSWKNLGSGGSDHDALMMEFSF